MKKAFFMIFALYSTLASAYTILESPTIDKVIPLVDKDTWFIVDLDNTVFQAKQALGHADWLLHEVNKLLEKGKSREEAFHTIYPLWKKTQILTEVVPMEDAFIDAIRNFQQRGITVMALTLRQLFIIPETLKQLNSIGVDFSVYAPAKDTIAVHALHPAIYTKGILFVDDFNTKGEAFQVFLRQLGVMPKKIVFVDDKKKNVIDMGQCADRLGIEFTGLYYTAIEHGHKIFSPSLAECQLKHFNGIMSNKAAQKLVDDEMTTIIDSSKDLNAVESVPMHLYKIISHEDWQSSLLRDHVVPSSMDTPCIHLAEVSQIAKVVEKYWKNIPYIILTIDTKKCVGSLVLETNPGGTNSYYHLYNGSIPLEAVVDVALVKKRARHGE